MLNRQATTHRTHESETLPSQALESQRKKVVTKVPIARPYVQDRWELGSKSNFREADHP